MDEKFVPFGEATPISHEQWDAMLEGFRQRQHQLENLKAAARQLPPGVDCRIQSGMITLTPSPEPEWNVPAVPPASYKGRLDDFEEAADDDDDDDDDDESSNECDDCASALAALCPVVRVNGRSVTAVEVHVRFGVPTPSKITLGDPACVAMIKHAQALLPPGHTIDWSENKLSLYAGDYYPSEYDTSRLARNGLDFMACLRETLLDWVLDAHANVAKDRALKLFNDAVE